MYFALSVFLTYISNYKRNLTRNLFSYFFKKKKKDWARDRVQWLRPPVFPYKGPGLHFLYPLFTTFCISSSRESDHSSGFHGHQVCVWYRHYMQIKHNKIKEKNKTICCNFIMPQPIKNGTVLLMLINCHYDLR